MKNLFRVQRCVVGLLCVSFLTGMLLGIGLVTNTDLTSEFLGIFKSENKKNVNNPGHSSASSKLISEKRHQIMTAFPRPAKLSHQLQDANQDFDSESDSEGFPKPNYNIHAFYYPWYGNPEIDGQYIHWNHPLLQHWNKQEAAKWPTGQHEPPADIGSNFYPELGPYSSRDPEVIDNHMQQLRTAGIGKGCNCLIIIN